MHETFLAILNHLKANLNPICHLLALSGAHHILHVSRIRVNVGSYSATKYCPFYGFPEHGKCRTMSRHMQDCYAVKFSVIGDIVKGAFCITVSFI
jgi:hypothetical protein